MILLASKSPRRKQLLSLICTGFEVVPSGFDETLIQEKHPEQLVRKLAQAKAQAVAVTHPGDIVIGCDTVVVSPKEEVFGIPKDSESACGMLRALSGATHRVITGVCVTQNGKKSVFHKTTKVTFMELSEADIAWYLSTGEPFDKAGAYGIQGFAGAFVEKINGDFNNVVGLPIQTLRKILQKYK